MPFACGWLQIAWRVGWTRKMSRTPDLERGHFGRSTALRSFRGVQWGHPGWFQWSRVPEDDQSCPNPNCSSCKSRLKNFLLWFQSDVSNPAFFKISKHFLEHFEYQNVAECTQNYSNQQINSSNSSKTKKIHFLDPKITQNSTKNAGFETSGFSSGLGQCRSHVAALKGPECPAGLFLVLFLRLNAFS